MSRITMALYGVGGGPGPTADMLASLLSGALIDTRESSTAPVQFSTPRAHAQVGNLDKTLYTILGTLYRTLS